MFLQFLQSPRISLQFFPQVQGTLTVTESYTTFMQCNPALTKYDLSSFPFKIAYSTDHSATALNQLRKTMIGKFSNIRNENVKAWKRTIISYRTPIVCSFFFLFIILFEEKKKEKRGNQNVAWFIYWAPIINYHLPLKWKRYYQDCKLLLGIWLTAFSSSALWNPY